MSCRIGCRIELVYFTHTRARSTFSLVTSLVLSLGRLLAIFPLSSTLTRVSHLQQRCPMVPKAQTSTARRGRPARGAAPETTIPDATMAPHSPPKKRGRAAKSTEAVEPPRKRGRPAKQQTDEPIAQIDSAIKRGRRSVIAAQEAVAESSIATKKRAGRPAKAVDVAEAATPKKRVGRPPKEDAIAEASATPKRRGRPALHLNRVAGSPRVAKRSSARSKLVTRAPPKAAAAPRINPKMRSRLRQRAAPVEKAVNEATQPNKKSCGRPKKVQAEVEAPAPKMAARRGRKASVPQPAVSAKKVTARPKAAAPQKRRGYTSIEVADRFAAQVKQFITDLLAEDAANAAAAAGEADDEGEDIEIEVELGPEHVTTGPEDDIVEEEEDAADLVANGEDDEMAIDPVDDTNDAILGQEPLARNGEAAAELVSEVDELDDETGLPSETAVLAEIAAVQDELDVHGAIQDDVEMAAASQPELERQGQSSSVAVDLHKDITEVVSIPQNNGLAEVNVFHAHVHEHVQEDARAPKPAAATSVGSLFGSL